MAWFARAMSLPIFLYFLPHACSFFFFFFYSFLFIWLCWVLVAARGLFSCSMWDLFSLWHVGSRSLARDWTPGPLHWELRVLATGPPGKSPGAYSKAFFALEPRVSPHGDQNHALGSCLMGGTALTQKEMLQDRDWVSGPGDPSIANGKKGVIFKEKFFSTFHWVYQSFPCQLSYIALALITVYIVAQALKPLTTNSCPSAVIGVKWNIFRPQLCCWLVVVSVYEFFGLLWTSFSSSV